ncbi:hypothetical protein [Caballeronia grimmiae]|uniref:hypothetical protein n=1 Tax=Caballeronia grimmiae TaxID=1071679 RepID=UPI0038BC0E7A
MLADRIVSQTGERRWKWIAFIASSVRPLSRIEQPPKRHSDAAAEGCLLADLARIVDLNPEVTDCTFKFGMA